MNQRATFLILIIISFTIAACSGISTVTPDAGEPQVEAPHVENPADESDAIAYSEAPMLAERVAAGELPPLEERLPEEPFVVGQGVYLTEEDLPDWTPGKFGGKLRIAHFYPDWSADVFVMIDEPFLMAPKIGDQGIVCAICERFEVSADNTEFTFVLRKGLKWSDGVPVTIEDVRFAWEDIRGNEQLYPIFPDRFKTGFSANGSPGVLEIIDETTFKITFDSPYGVFLRNLAIEGWVGYTEILEPAHYLKKFHPDYTDMEALKPMLEEMNLTDEWWQLFQSKRCEIWDMTSTKCVGYPALTPWVPVQTDTQGLLRFERNPYYYKVDTLGQQLPYIDTLESTFVDGAEMVNLVIMNGEVDLQRDGTSSVNIPMYKEREAGANYRVQILDLHVDASGLHLNQTFDDPNWQLVSQDIRFRQAISLAIDRQEIIDTIYHGYASLPLETMGEEWSQHDVDQANILLDEIGLTEYDDEGYRLYPDGTPISILLEHGGQMIDFGPICEMVTAYLKDIGLKVTVKQIDPSLWSSKNIANELQISVMWSHDIGWGNDITTGSVYRAGSLWGAWDNTSGGSGEQPPGWVQEALDLDARKGQEVPGSAKYNALVEEGFEWSRTNLPYINFVEQVRYPIIVNRDIRNVPQSGYAIAAVFSVVQMYYENP